MDRLTIKGLTLQLAIFQKKKICSLTNIRSFKGSRHNAAENMISGGNQPPHQWKSFPFYPEYKLISSHIKNKLKVKTIDITFIYWRPSAFYTSLTKIHPYEDKLKADPPSAFKRSQQTLFEFIQWWDTALDSSVIHHRDGGQRWGLRGQMGLVVLL